MRKLLTILLVIPALVSCGLYRNKVSTPPSEVTFMRVCWDEGNVATYPGEDADNLKKEDSCEHLGEISWDRSQFPLRVRSTIDDPALIIAMMVWNLQLEKDVFVFGDVGWDIGITTGPAHAPNALAGTVHFSDKGHLGAFVFMYEASLELDAPKRVAIYVHELGHVLGLGHDFDMPESTMYPYSNPAGELTAADLEAVRKRYVD